MPEARRVLGVAAAVALAAAGPVRSQTPEQPNLILTINAGFLTGGRLWSVARQAAPVPSGLTYVYDTLSLGRVLRPGLAASVSATYFRSPHLGYSVEVGFFGIGTESRCAPVSAYQPDPNAFNQRACQFIEGENINGDVVGFLAGFIWRATTGGPQPFIRAGVGGGILGTSYVETAAPVGPNASEVFFLTERSRKETTWMVSLGAGAMLPLAPGYQLRFEARDLIVALPIATGPAAPDTTGAHPPYAPVGTRVMHLPTLSIGLDVVLEKKRGRRY